MNSSINKISSLASGQGQRSNDKIEKGKWHFLAPSRWKACTWLFTSMTAHALSQGTSWWPILTIVWSLTPLLLSFFLSQRRAPTSWGRPVFSMATGTSPGKGAKPQRGQRQAVSPQWHKQAGWVTRWKALCFHGCTSTWEPHMSLNKATFSWAIVPPTCSKRGHRGNEEPCNCFRRRFSCCNINDWAGASSGHVMMIKHNSLAVCLVSSMTLLSSFCQWEKWGTTWLNYCFWSPD